VGSLVGLQQGEAVRTMLAVRDLESENKFIFFATHNGLVKKSALREFMHVRANGINAINIEQGDELVSARITNGQQIIFIASHEGMAVRFDESHVRPMGRAAYGVWGIDLDKNDYVVGMATTPKPGAEASATTERVGTGDSPVPGAQAPAGADGATPEPEVIDVAVKGSLILSVTENGFGKRTPADEYRLTNRGGKGVINLKTTERNGKVVGIAQVDETSEVMLISHYGKIIRMDSKTIRESGRNAQGVRLLHLEPGDRVAAAVVIAPEEEPIGTNGGMLIQ
jgi:DNA gyrase subunit A